MSALLLVLTSPFLAAAMGVYLVRTHNMRRADKQRVYYSVTYPRDMEPEQMTDWHRSVVAAMPPGDLLNHNESSVVTEWGRNDQGITHVIGVPHTHKELMGQLITAIQGVHFEELGNRPHVDWTVAAEYGISEPSLPLDVKRLTAQVNATLGSGLYEHKAGDEVRVQLVLKPSGHVTAEPSLIRFFFSGKEATAKVVAQREEKVASPTFSAVLRIVVKSDTVAHAKYILKNVERSYARADTVNVHLKRHWWARKDRVIDRFKRGATTFFVPAVFNSNEVTAFSAVPVAGVLAPGLVLGKTRYLPPNETIARDGRKLGNSVYDSFNHRPIAISEEGATRHVYAIGPSGRGKSVLLNNMAQQDIEAGHGVIVIDAKGDQFYPLLDAIPYNRRNEVAVLDFTDSDHPVGFNVLQEGVVDDIYSMFIHSSPDSVYLKDVLHHALHAFSYFPELTVVDVLPFVDAQTPMEKAWRDSLVERMPKNSAYRQHWQTFFSKSEREQREHVKPLANRMWELTSRRDVRNFLGQSQSTINLKQILRDNKILLVYLPENLGAPTVSLIGSLLVGNIWSAVRAVRDEKKSPTFLYMDEVQKFLNLPIDLPDMLSLARSYQLGLVMAHQYIDQLPKELFSAVTNASTKVAFKLDGPDAQRIQSLFGKAVTAEDFQALDPFQALVCVATPGGSSDPTVIKTYPPFKPHGHSEEVIRRSRAQFSRKAEDVDKEILRRRTAPSKTEKKRERTFGSRVKETGDE